MQQQNMRAKDRKGFNDFEAITLVLAENPSLRQRVLFKLRELRTLSAAKAKAEANKAAQKPKS